jgi:NAD(P)-dependent dehydrogenase (short-subunit alcohol dehydrogenase family)
MDAKLALVTGANRGIGFEIARQLARGGVQVILTARDEAKGQLAVSRLRKEGLDVNCLRLDVTDAAAIRDLPGTLARDFGGLDILVNNAGVMIDPKGSRVLDSREQTYRATLEANFFGPLLLCQALVPLMLARGGGRVVNLSSGMGQLCDMGPGSPAYRVSKAALNALTRTLAAELKGRNVLVNALCPGWVRTHMGGAEAPRSVEQGADTAVWLATLPDDGPSGGFFRDRQPIPW